MKFNYSQITPDLIIGNAPRTEAYHLLRGLGVRLVINMRIERRPHRDYHNPPLPVLWLPTFDSPVFPIPVYQLKRGAKAALETIAQGGMVYVHCAQGVHRGVAMGCAILIAQGYRPQEAMDLIKERRPVADPDIWYIKHQILKFAAAWKKMEDEGRVTNDGASELARRWAKDDSRRSMDDGEPTH